jgi:hypothetical protein
MRAKVLESASRFCMQERVLVLIASSVRVNLGVLC